MPPTRWTPVRGEWRAIPTGSSGNSPISLNSSSPSAQTLDALYAEATALLFPSLEEGFGLPVLEAMARGLPVIASNTSSLPEVAGDAAVLVDPRDTEAMAEAAQRMIEDDAWRANWPGRGHARASQFTWQRAARATLDVYRSLLLG